MSENRPHIVILGAGPAGLAAALRLRQTDKARVTVVERRSSVGGNAGSFRIGDQRVDFGSHRLHPSCDPEILEDLRQLLGEDLGRSSRHGRIRLCGRWIHFPLQPMDLLLRLDRRFAFGILGDMLLGGFRRRPVNAQTFSEVLRAQLGSTISEQFYLPYAAKIWGREPDRLSAVQARRRVSAGTFTKLLRKVFSAVPGVKPVGFDYFYYPRHGFGQIAEAYARGATDLGASLILGEPVVGLRPPPDRGSQWTVITESNDGQRTLEADQVWSTLPITLLTRLADPPPNAVVRSAAAAIQYRSMVLVYLQFDVDQLTEFDAHYFPDPAFVISRLSEPKNYTASGAPAGSTVLCAELPCHSGDTHWQMTAGELADLVIGDLERAGLSLPGRPTAIEIRRLGQAYPIYDLGFEDHLRRLEEWAEGLADFVSFGRQGLFVHDNTHHALFMGYCAVDCLSKQGLDKDCWEQYRRIFETHVVED